MYLKKNQLSSNKHSMTDMDQVDLRYLHLSGEEAEKCTATLKIMESRASELRKDLADLMESLQTFKELLKLKSSNLTTTDCDSLVVVCDDSSLYQTTNDEDSNSMDGQPARDASTSHVRVTEREVPEVADIREDGEESLNETTTLGIWRVEKC